MKLRAKRQVKEWGSWSEGSASGATDIDMQNKYEMLRLKSNTYPIHGDLSKVISYEDQREIFLSQRKAEKWKMR